MKYGLPISLQTDKPRQKRFAALKQVGWLVICTLASLPGIGCGAPGASITGSGNPVTKDYQLAEFSRLAVGDAFQLQIAQGPKHNVTVTVDDNLVEHLDVTRSGETLRIRMQPNLNIRNATLKAAITMPALTGLNLSGAVRATVTGFSSDESLEADLSGASSLRGDTKNGGAHFQVSGASKVQLQGSARTLKIRASGASHANLDEYQSSHAVAHASGASHVTVNTSGNLEADASGASSVRYLGEPSKVKAHTSGASSVRKK